MGVDYMKNYIGNPKQIFRVDEYRLIGGRGDGMRMIGVHNDCVEFVCSADRCMDLHYLRCKGQNLGFLTNAGDVAPWYYDDRAFGWMKSFTAGFMTTCGLRSIGSPGEFQGRHCGLHGRISNCPAEELGAQTTETETGPAASVRGVMRDSYPTGENLVLTREIETSFGDPVIHVHDVVENRGHEETIHMLLYHFNLGYPLLDEETLLLIPSREAMPRDRDAAARPDAWSIVEPPAHEEPERCYYHRLKADEQGNTCVAAFQPERKIGVAIHFNRNVLDNFVQWRQLTAGYYAMGLEPCNATIDGIADAVKNKSAKWLRPGERVVYDLDIEVLTEQTRFEELLAESETYRSF